MSLYRTPAKQISPQEPDRRSPVSPPQSQSVRRSIGEWETGSTSTAPTSPTKRHYAGPALLKQKGATVNRTFCVETRGESAKPTDLVAAAKACLIKAKSSLGEARNLKTDIKVEVTKCLDRLYQLIKESVKEKREDVSVPVPNENKTPEERNIVLEKIEENRQLMIENSKMLVEIKTEIGKQTVKIESAQTYASVAANPAKRSPGKDALHSIIVSSKSIEDTGETILNEVRDAVNAKEGWVRVEKVRKAKDQKVIVGCRTREERDKVKEKIEKSKAHLVVEDARNKNPLLIVRDVLLLNSDEDILLAIRNQNKDLFQGLDDDQSRIEIKYKKKARNPHTNHIVISTSPAFWRRATDIGSLHVDLQRVRVADQSPLVQCTKCLGYGHGRRFCTELSDVCSHCGGPHFSADCSDRLAGTAPSCRNCAKAKQADVEHNAFSGDCPVRRKWDAIARSTVAYC